MLRLLCVDDEPHITNAIERFCRNEGIGLLKASSASEALQIMEHEAVDLVLSDYHMPGMSGLELLCEVHHRWPHVTGFIVSGFLELPVIINAIEKGCIQGVLQKPWKREELKDLIDKAEKIRS